eukprot:Nitzschia sp. Nitz4//scaffold40_size135432//60594//62879//NITZ4_003243-RA/size135432-processed-gene-0.19-mRNA-1//1//CDS//3329551216//5967//frame0
MVSSTDMTSAAATELASSLSSLEKIQHTVSSSDSVSGGNAKISEEQLSKDLAQFLSNPSLKAALADGSLDLTSYSSTVEEELAELESQCIEAYRGKSSDIAQLCGELEHADGILLGLQELLLGFQADLGGLSGDIRQLQETSKRLGVQLQNRKSAAMGLRAFLGRIVLSPDLVQAITKGPIDASFQQAIKELAKIHKDTHEEEPQEWACGKSPADTAAGLEMQGHIQQLRLIAVKRIQEFFAQQMSLLRKPQTNIRILQSHGLLAYSDLYEFLLDSSPDTAQELFRYYTESMSKTLYALFRTYQAQLIQLDATKHAATRQDVIAVEDSYLRDSITTKAKKRVDVFTLGNRANILLNSKDPPIVAMVALSEHQTYPYERLFKSVLQHLVDAITNEHVVCREFFQRDAFESLFPATSQLLLEQLENYLFGCYDALSILLMIKVTHQFRRSAQSRTIHSLNPFFDQLTHLLWPRLKTVMELHTRSIKQATSTSLGGVDLHAHYVTRRFAEFMCSVLLTLQQGNKTQDGKQSNKLSSPEPTNRRESLQAARDSTHSMTATPGAKNSAGDMLLQDMNGMLDEYIALLGRLSEEHSVNVKQIVFMINNLDCVICIFQERRVAGGKELNRVLEKLMMQRELFVEEELLQAGFSKMIAFVQQTEASLAQNPSNDASTVNTQVVESLVREFASTWRNGMESINRNVLSYFSNFRNGMEILKQVLTQLLLYYTRFQDVIRKVFKGRAPPFSKDLVPTGVILAEIKKYALAI